MTTARERIDALRRENPSFRPWLALLEVALDAAGDPAWEGAARGATLRPADGGPALAGAVIRVDRRAAGRLIDRLLGAASADARAAARSVGMAPARWFAAGFGPDPKLVGDSPDLLPIADLAVMPLLLAFGRTLAERAGSGGTCPICDAWPTLAEMRGLDRARRLRCGRCAADWGIAPLRCPFCDNFDHEKLRSLVPESGGESRRIDACDVCRGYLKSLARLAPIRPELLHLEDLASVELDLAAIERDYRRPEAPRRLEARVEVV